MIGLSPEALMRSLSDIISDVCGTGCTYRETPLTPMEWEQIVARVELLRLMNARQEKQ